MLMPCKSVSVSRSKTKLSCFKACFGALSNACLGASSNAAQKRFKRSAKTAVQTSYGLTLGRMVELTLLLALVLTTGVRSGGVAHVGSLDTDTSGDHRHGPPRLDNIAHGRLAMHRPIHAQVSGAQQIRKNLVYNTRNSGQ